MNLVQYISISAGGPGSGRHAEWGESSWGKGQKPKWQEASENKAALDNAHQDMLDHGFKRMWPTSEISSRLKGDTIEHNYSNPTTGAEGVIREREDGQHTAVRYKP